MFHITALTLSSATLIFYSYFLEMQSAILFVLTDSKLAERVIYHLYPAIRLFIKLSDKAKGVALPSTMASSPRYPQQLSGESAAMSKLDNFSVY